MIKLWSREQSVLRTLIKFVKQVGIFLLAIIIGFVWFYANAWWTTFKVEFITGG